MIYDHFRLTEVDGAFLEFTDLLRVELKGDNLRAFGTLWGETPLAMGIMPEDHYLESLYFKQPARPGPVADSPKMIPPNRPGTYLIRRALKNDRDPSNQCLKRSHERQVMKVFVQRVIRSCFANNLRLLRKGTMVPWYHGTMVP